jgi:hypothetical protein
MRTDLVYLAKEQMPNRFELVHVTTKLARKSHRANTRFSNTINAALLRIGFPEAEFVGAMKDDKGEEGDG